VQANCRAATATTRSSLFAISLCVCVSLCVSLSRAILVCRFRGLPCFCAHRGWQWWKLKSTFSLFLGSFSILLGINLQCLRLWPSDDQFCCKIPGGLSRASLARRTLKKESFFVSSIPFFVINPKPRTPYVVCQSRVWSRRNDGLGAVTKNRGHDNRRITSLIPVLPWACRLSWQQWSATRSLFDAQRVDGNQIFRSRMCCSILLQRYLHGMFDVASLQH
jgi:hypothetical protein